VTIACNVVQLPVTHAEKSHHVAHGVAGKAFGTQVWIVERNGQQRIILAQRLPFGPRHILDLIQRIEFSSAFALQGRGPALKPLGPGHRASTEPLRKNLRADLIQTLILHEGLHIYRRTEPPDR
jgi:hypothetical protein